MIIIRKLSPFTPILSLFFPWIAGAQLSEQSQLGSNIDLIYLEHLVKIKVDSVRAVYNCLPLANDSILYVASKHHTNYMVANKRLTHAELTAESASPQDRAELYGAVNYLVGENVLKTPYNKLVISEKGKEFNTHTYGNLATSIVDGWVNSPGHFQNIITPSYEVTGLSISILPNKEVMYACQKFAEVQYQYAFKESSVLFPYSENHRPPIPANFDGIPNELIEHEYEWGLKHDRPSDCIDCEAYKHIDAGITLAYEAGQFVLKVENANYVRSLMNEKRDGFAVELVEYQDYACGNPVYYTKSSRRNGQLKLNGITTEPVYRDELFKGYKKKKKREKPVRFLSYLFQADSIPFFNRFYQYQFENYELEYFEIKLGKLPKNLSGYVNHNLVYIQNNQICQIDYFTGYCGELFRDSVNTELLPLPKSEPYSFLLDTVHLTFTIPFEKNKATFTEEDIAPFISSLANVDYRIDSLVIKAFASVEGDSLANERLQQTRAQNLIQVFETHQTESIETRVETTTSWEHFLQYVSRSHKWRHLSKLSRVELRRQLNNGLADSLDFVLEKERKASIDLYGRIPLTDANLAYYIKKERKRYSDAIVKLPAKSHESDSCLKKLDTLMNYTNTLVKDGKVDTSLLGSFPVPIHISNNYSLIERFLLYYYYYPNSFSNNKRFMVNRDYLAGLFNQKGAPKPSYLYTYTLARQQQTNLMNNRHFSQDEIQTILDNLMHLGSQYNSDKEFAKQIDRLTFNLNMILLNEIYPKNRVEHSKSANISLEQIYSYYQRYASYDDSIAYKLAKAHVYYGNVPLAYNLLNPYIHLDYIEAYAIPLGYIPLSFSNSKEYYNYLLELSENMNEYDWCNMFLNKCMIPFQAFDHEELRNTFCRKCLDQNKFLQELYAPNKRD